LPFHVDGLFPEVVAILCVEPQRMLDGVQYLDTKLVFWGFCHCYLECFSYFVRSIGKIFIFLNPSPSRVGIQGLSILHTRQVNKVVASLQHQYWSRLESHLASESLQLKKINFVL